MSSKLLNIFLNDLFKFIFFIFLILPFINILILKRKNKLECHSKRIFYETSIFYGVIFFICHELQKQDELKNSDSLIFSILVVLSCLFLSLYELYKLSIDKQISSLNKGVIITATLSIAVIMSSISETKNFILTTIYNLAYIAIPALVVYLIQKQDSKSNDEKINEILYKINNIEIEISKINKDTEKIQNNKSKKFWRNVWEKIKGNRST